MAGKVQFSDKSNFVERPSVPANQKFSAADANELKARINENYNRLVLDWDTDILSNQVLPVGQVILYNNSLYRIDESYSVGDPPTFDSDKATSLLLDAPYNLNRLISKSEHGFVAKNVITLDNTGDYVKVSSPDADKFVGIVTEVPDANSFRIHTAGYVTGLSDLTAGQIHYAQSDGTLGTTVTAMPVLLADTVTSGYLIGSGGALADYSSTPPNVLSATIEGQTMVGKQLTATYRYNDVDGTAEGTTTYQWVYADDVDGTNKQVIDGQTGLTYTLTADQIGKYIGIEITPKNINGETGDTFTFYKSDAVDDKYYPVDEIADTVVAVGLKKLASAYAGFCVQIQATNGGPTLDVGFVGDEPDWAAMAAFNGGAAVFMRIGYDQSGNGNHITITTFSQQPQIDFVNKRIIWTPSKLGNHGADSSLDIGTSDYTIFTVCLIPPFKDTQSTIWQKQTNFSSAHIAMQSSAPNLSFYSGSGTSNKDLLAPIGVWDLYLVARDGTNRHIMAEGIHNTYTESNNNVTSTGNLNRNTGSNGSGDFYEVAFIYAKSYAADDYNLIKKYLQHEQA